MKVSFGMDNETSALDWAALMEVAQSVGRSLADEFPGIDAEDISQEILAELLVRQSSIAKVDPRSAALRSTMRKIGQEYCTAERYRYTMNSGQYVYTPAEVRALFAEAFFDPAAWEQVPERETYEVGIRAGGVAVALWDLREAYYSLGAAAQDAIRNRHLGTDGDESGAAKRRYQRAIEEATKYLNRKMVAVRLSRDTHEDGPGARRAMTNAKAQAITRNTYSEEN